MFGTTIVLFYHKQNKKIDCIVHINTNKFIYSENKRFLCTKISFNRNYLGYYTQNHLDYPILTYGHAFSKEAKLLDLYILVLVLSEKDVNIFFGYNWYKYYEMR